MVRVLGCASLLVALAGLSGCGLGSGSSDLAKTIPTTAAVKATGLVHGGQQPVSGATIQLWAVGSTGFGSTPTALITTTVTTSDGSSTVDSNANSGNANNTLTPGSFTLNFTNAYACPSASTLVYMTATGGNPGLGGTVNNSASVLLAALGQCGSLNSGSYIILNEVTTVGATVALSPFMSAAGNIGSPSDAASLQAIANAFAAVPTMVNYTTGTAFTGYPKVNTLANALVPCVNSTGPTSSACTTLFPAATPSGGITPSTVLGAIWNIMNTPTLNTTGIYNISTANAAFLPDNTSAPALWNVGVSTMAQSACGAVGGGDTINGTIAYSGTQTGRIYIAVANSTSGCLVGSQGTSISAPGTFTIRGVPAGSNYYLEAFMDTQGYGVTNATNPTGTTSTFSVGVASGTAPTLTLTDPGTVTITTAPTLSSVGPFSGGAVVQFKGVKNSNQVEASTSYTLQWSTSSTFATIAGSKLFPANGTNLNVWFVTGLSNSTAYYFRAFATSGGTAQGPYSSTLGPVTVGPTSGGSAVSGSISFTGAASGPLYAGFYNQTSNSIAPFVESIATPASAQAYTVNVTNNASAVYIPIGIIDQNNDGLIDAGDITNVSFQGGPIAVTGPITGQNLTLPSGDVTANITTQHYYQSGASSGYAFYLLFNFGTKQPVGVTLLNSYNADGASIDNGPIDLANCASSNINCNNGQTGFQIYFKLNATAPAAGDTYLFNVTYSDNTTSTMALEVNNVLSTPITSPAPTTGTSTSTTPTFTWTDPSCGACSTYTYTFYLADNSGNEIWGVPNNGNGLPPGTNSITWAVDPTDPSNLPTIGSLSTSTTYSYSVTVQDSNYNQAIDTVSYQP